MRNLLFEATADMKECGMSANRWQGNDGSHALNILRDEG